MIQGIKDVLEEVLVERIRQTSMWDELNDIAITPGTWVQLIQDYAACARIKAGQDNRDEYRNHLVKVAALAVAAIQAHDTTVRVDKQFEETNSVGFGYQLPPLEGEE